MKKEDLMIGDWVNIQSEKDDEPMYSQVEQLWECEIDADFQTDYENVHPIPLTKEILLKNGFEDFSGGGCIIKKLDDDEMPTLYIWDGNNAIYVVDEYSMNKYTYIKDCKYVHEFQHELKSCGIEKEIIL